MSKTRELALVILSITALILFNNPILSIFNRLSFKWGIPVLYFGFFVLWLGVVVATFLIVSKTEGDNTDE
jgi:predicted membrane protein